MEAPGFALAAMFGGDMRHDCRHVLGPHAERRQRDRLSGEPAEQIGAETTVAGVGDERRRGGRHDSRSHADALAAGGADLAVAKNPREAPLDDCRQIAEMIDEERAAPSGQHGGGSATRLEVAGPGARPVAEQDGLDLLGAPLRTVDFDERLTRA